MNEPVFHEPVLVREVTRLLAPGPGQLIVDATLGHGGHSLEILSRFGGEGLLVGIDRDPQMLATARKRIEAAHIPRSCYKLIQADHAEFAHTLDTVLAEVDYSAPDGVLFDLGPSTPQLLDPSLGLSWTSGESLDMRINPEEEGPSAVQIVNTWPEAGLKEIFRDHADERWAGPIAKMIVRMRKEAPIETGTALADIVCRAIPREAWPPKIHPATRVFLALRIEVNGEYRKLEAVLPEAFERLRPGGRLVVITFHSGEDRRVKEFMRKVSTPPPVPWPLPQAGVKAAARLLTRKPLTASPEELERNPRSRSAKVRAVMKLAPEDSN